MTLTEFLRARIAEDEAALPRFADEPPFGALDTVSPCDCAEDHAQTYYLAISPSRWRAECEAKRRIVEREGQRHTIIEGVPPHRWIGCDLEIETEGGSYVAVGDDERREFVQRWFRPVATGTLRDLALPYADHPEWREEWRP